MSKEDAPFKMKGNPMQRNFGIGSPLYDHEKDDSGNVIKHEKTKDWFAEDKRTDAEKKDEEKRFKEQYGMTSEEFTKFHEEDAAKNTPDTPQ